MKLLAANRSVLARRHPQALKNIEAVLPDCADVVICGQGARSILKVKQGEYTLHPCGTSQPQQLVQRWFEHFNPEPRMLYALSGFGLGHHIRGILEKGGKHCYLFIGENDPQRLAKVLSEIDCSDLLNDPRIMLGTGPFSAAYFKALRGFQFSEVKQAKPLIYSPLYSLDENYYERFFKEFSSFYESSYNLYRTNILYSAIMQENMLKNMPLMLGAPDIATTAGALVDVPVVLVGAGPSLDEAMDFLREARKKAIIICGNTAYRTLLRHQIVPQVTLALDPHFGAFKGYSDGIADQGFLVSPYFVYPEVAQAFAGRIFTWNRKHALVDVVRSRMGQNKGTPLVEQGTVSASIVDLARFWGCRKICLVGQDMALTAQGKMYSSDSFYADEGRDQVDLEQCKMFEGNTLPQVPVERRFIAYLKIFERLVEDYPNIDFVNTAQLGVKVRGIPYRTYEDALQWLKNSSSAEAELFLEKHCATHTDQQSALQNVHQALQPTYKFSKKLLTLCCEAALCHELLPDKFGRANYQKHARIRQSEAYVDTINKWLDDHPDDYRILVEGQTKVEMYRYLERCRDLPEDIPPHWRHSLKNREYFWALAEGAFFLFTRLDQLLNPEKAAGITQAM